MTVPDGVPLDGAVVELIREGLAAAERGDTDDLGSFAQYAAEVRIPAPSFSSSI